MFEIGVDASGLTPGLVDADVVTRSPVTVAEPISLSVAQRRVLLALCEPLLTQRGPRALPATYAQIGRALGLRPQYVRNIVQSLRETLAGYGVAGLTREHEDPSHNDFRPALAR